MRGATDGLRSEASSKFERSFESSKTFCTERYVSLCSAMQMSHVVELRPDKGHCGDNFLRLYFAWPWPGLRNGNALETSHSQTGRVLSHSVASKRLSFGPSYNGLSYGSGKSLCSWTCFTKLIIKRAALARILTTLAACDPNSYRLVDSS